MDELTLVRDLGLETPLPDTDRLAPARARLLRETRSRRRSRQIFAGLGAAGLAAAAAAVLVITAPGPRAAEPAIPTPIAFMNAAAEAALAQPDVVPRPDQFVYVLTEQGNGTRDEFWYSVDGKHDGLRDGPEGREKIPGCPHGKPGDLPPEQGGTCFLEPHFLPDLPTTGDAMVAWLRDQNKGHDSAATMTNGIAKDMMFMSQNNWLLSKQRAALYQAATKIPGLRLVPGQKDAEGRTGIGVTWDYAEGQIMWIFDSKTYVLLSLLGSTSRMALVDKPGDRP